MKIETLERWRARQFLRAVFLGYKPKKLHTNLVTGEAYRYLIKQAQMALAVPGVDSAMAMGLVYGHYYLECICETKMRQKRIGEHGFRCPMCETFIEKSNVA